MALTSPNDQCSFYFTQQATTPGMRQSKLFIEEPSEELYTDLLTLNRRQ
jgi:hypothetical protein